MKNKTLWAIIFGLVLINSLIIAFYITDEEAAKEVMSIRENNDQVNEIIATVGDKTVTREQWMEQLESRYGKEILRELINQLVVKEMANNYNITVPEDEINREMTMIKTMYNSFDNENLSDEKKLRDQIEYSILLEELLTKDVVVSEEQLESFYGENKSLYDIRTTFNLSHIIVNTKEEAEQVLSELKNGSSFSVLAMERSKDEFSANQGGDLGFISSDSEFIPQQYVEVAKGLKVNEWSKPIKVKDGYAIILLNERVEGVTYSFEEVKSQIRRQFAIEQMNGTITAQPFWDEVGVTWFYDK